MTTTPLRVDGVDLSHWQDGPLDFARARKAGLRFVYHKATEGDAYVDPLHDQRRAEVAKAGLAWGAYHFARPETGDAAREAAHFLATAKPKPGDLVPMLDLETLEDMPLAAVDTWARTFANVVHSRLGVWPIIYTPFNLPSVRHLALWVARYSNTNAPPHVPVAWDTWTIRQFSDGTHGVPSSFPGIGNADLNQLGTGVALDSLTIPKPRPTKAETRAKRRARRTRLRRIGRAAGVPVVACLNLPGNKPWLGPVALAAHRAVRKWNRDGVRLVALQELDSVSRAAIVLHIGWRVYSPRPNNELNGGRKIWTAIAYRVDAYELIEGGQLDVRIHDNVKQRPQGRIITQPWGYFRERGTDLRFKFMSVHNVRKSLDAAGNRRGLALEREWVKDSIFAGVPAVCAGDINARPKPGELAADEVRGSDVTAIWGAGVALEHGREDTTTRGRVSDHAQLSCVVTPTVDGPTRLPA